MNELQTLVFVTCTWALATILYYYAGKAHGYNKGFCDGLVRGHKDVLEFIKGANKPNSKE